MAVRKVYQFRTELFDYEPLIWRRFQVTSDITLSRFCYILMTLFEMEASHLFMIGFPLGEDDDEKICKYELPSDDDRYDYETGDELPNITTLKLSDIMEKAKGGFVFTYDYGDNWNVTVELEQEFTDEKYRSGKYPRVLEGEGYGIIENCGGVYRLGDVAEAYKKKKGRRYEEFREWLGIEGIDLSVFDKKDMNFRLKKIPQIYEILYKGFEANDEDIYLIEREYLNDGSNI